MMPDHEFCDDCPGCRPAMLDMKTGEVLAADNPIMVKVNEIWDHQTTYAQRRSFIEVTLHNSQNLVDLQRMEEVSKMIEEAIEE